MSGRTRRLEAERRRRQQRVIAAVVISSILVVGVLVVVLVAGGSDDPPTADGRDASVVSMIEMAFVPDPIDVSGDDARLRIVNDGEVPHSFVVPELGKGTPDLDPGQELVVDLTEAPRGTYRVICDVPGHLEAGMETELILR